MNSVPKSAPWWSLRRVTSGGHYLPSIDGLRFVAILGVILFHLGGQMVAKHNPGTPDFTGPAHLGFVAWGGYGVRLFFVISGFILALPYARARFGGRKPPTVRAFYLRRLTRLEPPYFLNIFALFVLAPLVAAGVTFGDLLPHLGAHLVYSNNLLELWRKGSLSPVTWSLEVELQFYLLVPLIMRVFAARPAVTRSMLAVGIVLFSLFDFLVQPRYPWVENFLPDQAQFFLMGVLLSEIYSSRDDRNLVLWDVLAVAAFIAAIPVFADRKYATILVVPMGIVLYAALASRFLSRLLALTPFAVIGGMCYTVYLWHFAVISLVWRFTSRFTNTSYDASLLVQCAVVLPAIFLFSAALFILVERPCMDRDWPAKVWRFFAHRSAPKDVEPVIPPDAPEIVDEPKTERGL